MLIAQHFLSLLTAVALGCCYYVAFEKSVLKSCMVAGFCAVSSGQLLFAHTIMSEGLYTFLLVTAVLVLFLARDNKRVWLWGACAACLFLALTVRPVGQSAVIAFLLVIAINWRRFRKQTLVFVATFFSLLLMWCGINRVQKGFFGMSRLGPIALFGTTAHLLDPNSIDDNVIRSILTPIYAAPSSMMNEPNWVRFSPDGPVQALEKAGYADAKLDGVLNKLTLMAICHRPVQFMEEQLKNFCRFVWKSRQRSKVHSVKRIFGHGGIDALCEVGRK